MLQMLLPRVTKDQNIIQINNNKLTQVWSKDVINEAHECGWRIRQHEWHYHPLEKPKFGLERCLPCVCCLHAHLMIPGYKVHLSEEASPL
jgi:hypothetical protein